MKKKVNLVLAGLVLAGLAVFLTVEGAEAFCVYNNTDTLISVYQTGGHKTGRGFHKRIARGENECCNWSAKDCNKEGEKDSIVKFTVSDVNQDLPICYNVAIQAGGWLTVEGSKGYYKCVRHDYQ